MSGEAMSDRASSGNVSNGAEQRGTSPAVTRLEAEDGDDY